MNRKYDIDPETAASALHSLESQNLAAIVDDLRELVAGGLQPDNPVAGLLAHRIDVLHDRGDFMLGTPLIPWDQMSAALSFVLTQLPQGSAGCRTPVRELFHLCRSLRSWTKWDDGDDLRDMIFQCYMSVHVEYNTELIQQCHERFELPRRTHYVKLFVREFTAPTWKIANATTWDSQSAEKQRDSVLLKVTYEDSHIRFARYTTRHRSPEPRLATMELRRFNDTWTVHGMPVVIAQEDVDVYRLLCEQVSDALLTIGEYPLSETK